jgi:secreted protein with Ig-like and vWFA domain
MEEPKTTSNIFITEGAQAVLTSWGVTVNEDGTLTHKDSVVTPVGINPQIDLQKVESVAIDLSEKTENALYVGYRIAEIEYYFEVAVEKNEQGEDILYFYIL